VANIVRKMKTEKSVVPVQIKENTLHLLYEVGSKIYSSEHFLFSSTGSANLAYV
jgi:hypothetical protein